MDEDKVNERHEHTTRGLLLSLADGITIGCNCLSAMIPARINSIIWLQDILRRIGNHPINKINELLPQNWKPLA